VVFLIARLNKKALQGGRDVLARSIEGRFCIMAA
jgi:hypothetical protein